MIGKTLVCDFNFGFFKAPARTSLAVCCHRLFLSSPILMVIVQSFIKTNELFSSGCITYSPCIKEGCTLCLGKLINVLCPSIFIAFLPPFIFNFYKITLPLRLMMTINYFNKNLCPIPTTLQKIRENSVDATLRYANK
jgi:hypothetical protein